MLRQEEREKKKKKIAGFALILRWERQRRPQGEDRPECGKAAAEAGTALNLSTLLVGASFFALFSLWRRTRTYI